LPPRRPAPWSSRRMVTEIDRSVYGVSPRDTPTGRRMPEELSLNRRCHDLLIYDIRAGQRTLDSRWPRSAGCSGPLSRPSCGPASGWSRDWGGFQASESRGASGRVPTRWGVHGRSSAPSRQRPARSSPTSGRSVRRAAGFFRFRRARHIEGSLGVVRCTVRSTSRAAERTPCRHPWRGALRGWPHGCTDGRPPGSHCPPG
jgi:hypothetical protein